MRINIQRLQILCRNFCFSANSIFSADFECLILCLWIILLADGNYLTVEHCSIKCLFWSDNQSLFQLHNNNFNILCYGRSSCTLYYSLIAGNVENRWWDWSKILL
jgi:hypothetical protein